MLQVGDDVEEEDIELNSNSSDVLEKELKFLPNGKY